MITLFYLSIYLIIQFVVGCRKAKSRRDQNIKAHYQYFLTWSSHSFQIPTHESMTETPEPTHQTQNPSPNFTISEHSTPSMANTGEGSSANAKPVIVRVKRKAFQSLLEAFCEFQALFLFLFLRIHLFARQKKQAQERNRNLNIVIGTRESKNIHSACLVDTKFLIF